MLGIEAFLANGNGLGVSLANHRDFFPSTISKLVEDRDIPNRNLVQFGLRLLRFLEPIADNGMTSWTCHAVHWATNRIDVPSIPQSLVLAIVAALDFCDFLVSRGL